MKRLYYLIIIVSVVAINSPNLFAAEGDMGNGSGTEADPYLIEDFADFNTFASDPNYWADGVYTQLTVNIDLDPNLPDRQVYATAVIAPDTNEAVKAFQGTPFAGVFDGDGYSISNLTIDTLGIDGDFLGMFGHIIGEQAQVKNLRLDSISVIGGSDSWNVGGLCGWNTGIISNCYSIGTSNGYKAVGGLCGNNYGKISNCSSECSVNGVENVGGLCGHNDGTISNCYATGWIAGGVDSWKVGGLCGQNYGTISNCYATASVSGGNYLGGLCGVSFEDGTISNSYVTGSVTGQGGSSRLGGLCGYNIGTISNCGATGFVSGGDSSYYLGGLCGYNYDTISNCYANGSVIGGVGSYGLGGLCGKNYQGTITNCYSTGLVSGTSDVGGLCGSNSGAISNSYFLDIAGPDNGFGTPLTDDHMKQQASFVSWDFVCETANGTEDIWTIKEGLKYPEHVWLLVQYYDWDGVDFADYFFFSNHWLLTDCNDVNDCNSTDLDFSGSVDNNDLNIFTTYWLFAK